MEEIKQEKPKRPFWRIVGKVILGILLWSNLANAVITLFMAITLGVEDFGSLISSLCIGIIAGIIIYKYNFYGGKKNK